jgi:hypothetical protein
VKRVLRHFRTINEKKNTQQNLQQELQNQKKTKKKKKKKKAKKKTTKARVVLMKMKNSILRMGKMLQLSSHHTVGKENIKMRVKKKVNPMKNLTMSLNIFNTFQRKQKLKKHLQFFLLQMNNHQKKNCKLNPRKLRMILTHLFLMKNVLKFSK